MEGQSVKQSVDVVVRDVIETMLQFNSPRNIPRSKGGSRPNLRPRLRYLEVESLIQNSPLSAVNSEILPRQRQTRENNHMHVPQQERSLLLDSNTSTQTTRQQSNWSLRSKTQEQRSSFEFRVQCSKRTKFCSNPT